MLLASREGWDQGVAAAARAMCERCRCPERYSPARYRSRTNRGERLHLMKGHPKVFKACMASNVWNLLPVLPGWYRVAVKEASDVE